MTVGILKRAILVVSFGTSYHETRRKTIEAVEGAVRERFGGDYEVRRAFTSEMIRRKLKKKDGLEIDGLREAMEKLAREGYKTLAVQPAYVMNGFEYDEMMETAASCERQFEKVVCGKPLLSSEEDFEEMAEILAEETGGWDQEQTGFLFMGHGTKHSANAAYARLDRCLKEKGYGNCFVGTMDAVPSLEDAICGLESFGARRAVLLPLLIVAGDHAVNDMAGDGDNSWKSVLEKRGYLVTCVMKGLGEYQRIQDMFVEHTQNALDLLGETNRV